MAARERWQALQSRLTAARAAIDAGDRQAALDEVAAALEIDPDFLAAHSLRDRILSMPEDGAARPTHAAASHAAPSYPAPSYPAPSHPVTSPPPGPPAAYATFEQRARRRRVDRRIDAARAAIEQHRLNAAAAALDEVIDLDPNLPELAELTARFDELRRTVATPRRGPRLAAAAVFADAMFGGSWLQDSSPILANQMVAAAPFRTSLTPIVTVTTRIEAIGAMGERGPSPVPSVDDSLLVNQALLGNRWTSDAAAAPVGFDACDPRVDGDAATAVCRTGVDTWNVTLRKVGDHWKVERARADR